MPVRWSPDMDQMLLLKILETHDISVDTKKISAAWPSDKGEVPTPRAITERLVKIRQNARAQGGAHFGISSSQSKSSSGRIGIPKTLDTATNRPKTTTVTAAGAALPRVSPQPSPPKRKRIDIKIDSDDEDIPMDRPISSSEGPTADSKPLIGLIGMTGPLSSAPSHAVFIRHETSPSSSPNFLLTHSRVDRSIHTRVLGNDEDGRSSGDGDSVDYDDEV